MLCARGSESQLREILDALDAACAEAVGDVAEALEELNAEFEDALFLLAETDAADADPAEALWDVLEVFGALLADYRRLAARFAPLSAPVERLDALIRAAKADK